MTTRRLMQAAAVALAIAGMTGGRAAAGADVGATLANHELASFDGGKTKLASMRGDVVVVNFWATWCAPCRKELALFDGWNAEWKGRGARVVAISIDKDARKARRFAEEMGLQLTVVHDGPDGLARSLDLPSVPCTYLLDRDGNVVSVVRTSSHDELAVLKGKVDSMVAGRKTPPQAAGMGSSATMPFNGDSR
ncbi:MAG TPA: TlpA disulfide reductase family protein [Candidatus Krumholzibacteria bacterium]|nr:TlpA disulfide reductase family protein [Candidatus Krumholzibacteria bacterium]